jgi:hypothetical protein
MIIYQTEKFNIGYWICKVQYRCPTMSEGKRQSVASFQYMCASGLNIFQWHSGSITRFYAIYTLLCIVLSCLIRKISLLVKGENSPEAPSSFPFKGKVPQMIYRKFFQLFIPLLSVITVFGFFEILLYFLVLLWLASVNCTGQTIFCTFDAVFAIFCRRCSIVSSYFVACISLYILAALF